MASGILGQAAPSATTNTIVYTVPATTYTVANVNIANRGASSITVRLALASSASPTNSEYIEYDAIVPAKGVLERTGIVLQAGKNIVVYASTNESSVSVYGIEQAV